MWRNIAPRLLDRNGGRCSSDTRWRRLVYKQYLRAKKKKDPDYEGWQFPTAANPHRPHADRGRAGGLASRLQGAIPGRVRRPIEQAPRARRVPTSRDHVGIAMRSRPLSSATASARTARRASRCGTTARRTRWSSGFSTGNAYRGLITHRAEQHASLREIVIHGFGGENVPLPKPTVACPRTRHRS